jgi:hypothetical protein
MSRLMHASYQGLPAAVCTLRLHSFQMTLPQPMLELRVWMAFCCYSAGLALELGAHACSVVQPCACSINNGFCMLYSGPMGTHQA